MKQVKSVEIFADVKCENCVSFNESRCYEELPAIPTEPDNKCGEGVWMLKGKTVNYRGCCMELLPTDFVTDVEDLICKNCGYYDSSKEECHYQKLNIYKSAPEDWCTNNGVWLYRDKDIEVILGSMEFLYEKLMEGRNTEEK